MRNWINLEKLQHGIGQNFVAPRVAVQGALFSSLVFRGRTMRPAYITPTQVAEWGDKRVIQTAGEQLDQGDADVYFELVRRATEQEELCLNIKSDEFLSAINRERGSESRNWLECSIERLKNASFEFSITELPVKAKLLVSVERNVDSKTAADFVVVLSDSMSQVFEAGKTIIKTKERFALGNDSLAKSLHSFFSSHSKQYESKIGVEKLMAATGRQSMRKDRFCAAVAESITVLKQATGWIIDFDGKILKMKQCEQATKLERKAKAKVSTPPKATGQPGKEAASVKTQKDSEPKLSDYETTAELEVLSLIQLVRLMNAETKAKYDAHKEEQDFEQRKGMALMLLDTQAYRETGSYFSGDI